jgi:hypothetical protein
VRLEPDASAAVQVAALFHDVERLASEADRRIEHEAADYDTFKRDHAERSAVWIAAALSGVAPGDVVIGAARLVAAGDRSQAGAAADPDLALLEEADALSFFSLNSGGFLDYYGEPHTEHKIEWTLRRLGPRGRRAMPRLRLRSDVARLVDRRVAS